MSCGAVEAAAEVEGVACGGAAGAAGRARVGLAAAADGSAVATLELGVALEQPAISVTAARPTASLTAVRKDAPGCVVISGPPRGATGVDRQTEDRHRSAVSMNKASRCRGR